MRARVSMRWTVTLFTGFFLTVSLGLMFAATWREARRQWTEDSLRHARGTADLLACASQEPLESGDTASLHQLVRQVVRDDMVERVIVLGRDGIVVSDSAPSRATPLLAGKTFGFDSVVQVEPNGEYVQVRAPISQNQAPLGAVLVRYSLQAHQAMMLAILQRGVLMAIITILASCAVAYCLAGVISMPLQRLARGMEAIAQGQLRQRLAEDGCREMRQMAHSFNYMAESLRRRMREMESLPTLVLAVTRSLNLGKVVQASVESVENALPETHARIWLLDAAAERLVEGGGRSLLGDGAGVEALSSDSVLAQAAQQRQPILAGGPDGHTPVAAWSADRFDACSRVAVPLCAGGTVVGVLEARRYGNAAPLLRDDLPFLSAAANQIALSIDNARLFDREKRMAGIFHHLLLPPTPAAIPGLAIAARWRPAPGEFEAAGDYYDFIPLPDGRWGIVIGDVCGKGILAASYTTMAKYVLRSYAYEAQSPAEILQRTNSALHALMNETDADRDGPSFVTMLCALYDPATGRLAYSHAGHPLGTLARADHRGAVALTCGGPPVGVVAEASYTEESLYLCPGDTLALYTDGVVEAGRGEGLLEPERIAELLSARQEDSVQMAADALMEEVARLADGTSSDDVTLLVLRVSSNMPPFTFPCRTNELASPTRGLGARV